MFSNFKELHRIYKIMTPKERIRALIALLFIVAGVVIIIIWMNDSLNEDIKKIVKWAVLIACALLLPLYYKMLGKIKKETNEIEKQKNKNHLPS